MGFVWTGSGKDLWSKGKTKTAVKIHWNVDIGT